MNKIVLALALILSHSAFSKDVLFTEGRVFEGQFHGDGADQDLAGDCSLTVSKVEKYKGKCLRYDGTKEECQRTKAHFKTTLTKKSFHFSYETEEGHGTFFYSNEIVKNKGKKSEKTSWLEFDSDFHTNELYVVIYREQNTGLPADERGEETYRECMIQ